MRSTLRAIEVLEQIGSAEARALLQVYAMGLPGHRATDAARSQSCRAWLATCKEPHQLTLDSGAIRAATVRERAGSALPNGRGS